MALGTTIDPEEERELAGKVDWDDMEITMSSIASLTIDCLATFLPNKCARIAVVAVAAAAASVALCACYHCRWGLRVCVLSASAVLAKVVVSPWPDVVIFPAI